HWWCLDFRSADTKPLPLRAFDFALSRIRFSSRARILFIAVEFGTVCVFTVQSSPFRSHLERLLDKATEYLLVASPYIKTSEAEWVCDRLVRNGHNQDIEVRVITDVRSANVLSGSLDVAALRVLQS